jgi:GNAT superfamily N-acetyltransferase
MISIGRLEARDRAAWEELFAGYHAFYGRPSWPRENYDEAWSRFEQDDQIHARAPAPTGASSGSCTSSFTRARPPQTTATSRTYLTAPQARGRGVARALIAEVGHWAREQGCARVYWHTQSGNKTARRLYDQVAENRGFIQYLIQL